MRVGASLLYGVSVHKVSADAVLWRSLPTDMLLFQMSGLIVGMELHVIRSTHIMLGYAVSIVSPDNPVLLFDAVRKPVATWADGAYGRPLA